MAACCGNIRWFDDEDIRQWCENRLDAMLQHLSAVLLHTEPNDQETGAIRQTAPFRDLLMKSEFGDSARYFSRDRQQYEH